MAILKEEEFETFLGRRLANFSCLLIHGDDEGLVSSLARQAILKLSGESGTSLLVDQMDSSTCKKSPGIFLDAINAISLLGDRRLLVVDSVDDSCMGFLGEALTLRPGGNFVLLKSSSLKRDSSLRKAFENAPQAAAMAIYPDDGKIAAARASSFLDTQGLVWGEHAEQSFFALVGYDRAVVNQELAKLGLYCLGKRVISAADVDAICGDLAEESYDGMVDAILSGDLTGFDRAVGSSSGSDIKAVLPILASHLSRLVAMMSAQEGGQSLDQVMRNAKPPIFFKRRAAIAGQLSRLSLDEIVRLQSMVQSLVLKSRQTGEISSAVIGRGLLVMARNLKPRTMKD